MTTPTSIEVTLPVTAEGSFIKDFFGDPIAAVKVTHRAHLGPGGLVVSVTAFTGGHRAKTWMNPAFFVTPGLDSTPPPEWVPGAPEWFWDAVGEMEAAQ